MYVLCALAHLFGRIIQRHDARALFEESAVRYDKHIAFAVHALRLFIAVFIVDANRQVARQLDVLLLVIADRNDIRIVQENIRRHQNRISQKPRADGFLTLTLCLELRHAEQLACVRAAVQNPAKLRVSRHL